MFGIWLLWQPETEYYHPTSISLLDMYIGVCDVPRSVAIATNRMTGSRVVYFCISSLNERKELSRTQVINYCD
jgi:hypothetical protein